MVGRSESGRNAFGSFKSRVSISQIDGGGLL